VRSPSSSEASLSGAGAVKVPQGRNAESTRAARDGGDIQPQHGCGLALEAGGRERKRALATCVCARVCVRACAWCAQEGCRVLASAQA
jgi:hypothetical protein